jgi:hypothetical protein
MAEAPERCVYCGKTATRVCGRCEDVKYCSKACSARDWPRHSIHCVPVSVPGHRKLRGLIGPNYFAFFPNIDGRRILLIGETHMDPSYDIKAIEEKGPGPVFEEHRWLRSLIIGAPECVDLMVEEDFIADLSQKGEAEERSSSPAVQVDPDEQIVPKLVTYRSNIRAIKAAFAGCYTTDVAAKKTCFTTKLRFHYIDTRRFISREDKKTIVQSALTVLHRESREIIDGEIKLNAVVYPAFRSMRRELLKRMFAYAIGEDATETSKKIYRQFMRNVIENWFLFNQGHYDRTEVKKMMRDERLYISVLQAMTERRFRKAPSISRARFVDALTDVIADSGLPLAMMNAPMDAHCLLRIFALYEEAKLPRGPEGCRSLRFLENRNVIVHSGRAHSKTYTDFFKRYFGAVPSLLADTSATQNYVLLQESFDFFAPAP